LNLLFDMNMSPKITEIIVELGYSAIHAKNIFSQDTPDDEIIQYASDHDLVIVTYDGKMRKAHREAYREYGTRVIFITSGVGDNSLIWQVEWYNSVWPKCYRKIESLPTWQQVRMAANGDVHVYS
jgi:predicted nuclease of predicted toxin-antitoxin system